MTVVSGEQVQNPWRYRRVLYSLFISNGVAILLFALRSFEAQTDRYWFLLWNLVLAWVPLAIVWLLVKRISKGSWLTWQNIALTLIWLVFLPNSFYLISDLIHLHETGEVSLMYDVVMFSSFIFNGLIAGMMSLFLVHRELYKRVSAMRAYTLVGAVLLACSYAIYLGRSLRWNSWDMLISPAGMLFDVSEQVVNPTLHTQTFTTTMMFFVLLMSIYAVLWEMTRALKAAITDKNLIKYLR